MGIFSRFFYEPDGPLHKDTRFIQLANKGNLDRWLILVCTSVNKAGLLLCSCFRQPERRRVVITHETLPERSKRTRQKNRHHHLQSFWSSTISLQQENNLVLVFIFSLEKKNTWNDPCLVFFHGVRALWQWWSKWSLSALSFSVCYYYY